VVEDLRREAKLLSALVAVHGMLSKGIHSKYAPTRAELAELASSLVANTPAHWVDAFTAALEPMTKVWELLQRLDALGRRFRSRKAA
jgi:hypothetical protein